jgi:anti-sigma-K factor RskA
MPSNMTLSGRDTEPNGVPSDIEALLPWYAAGRLRRRDRQRVEEALRDDADLARQVDLVREELAETIHLNETLGAPPPRVADRLMAAIDAETQAKRKRAPGAAAGWLTGFFASLSPRTMAVAASFATLAIALQAFMLVDVFTKPPSSSVVSDGSSVQHRNGTFAMVRFARQASAAEITNFLQQYQAALVDGPTQGGLYRVRLAMTSLAKEELARVVQRMRQDRIVESAEPSE